MTMARFFVVFATSGLLVAASCKSRTFNKIIGNESSDDANRSNQGSSPDACPKMKPGTRIAISANPEIRVRDAYTPMSLVQSERRYLISIANKTVQVEETSVGIDCCDARPNDTLVTKTLSDDQAAALQQELASITLSADLRCASEPEIKSTIQKASCDSQAGHIVLLDENRVIPDSQSCVPTSIGLWGQANGLAEVAKRLKTIAP